MMVEGRVISSPQRIAAPQAERIAADISPYQEKVSEQQRLAEQYTRTVAPIRQQYDAAVETMARRERHWKDRYSGVRLQQFLSADPKYQKAKADVERLEAEIAKITPPPALEEYLGGLAPAFGEQEKFVLSADVIDPSTGKIIARVGSELSEEGFRSLENQVREYNRQVEAEIVRIAEAQKQAIAIPTEPAKLEAVIPKELTLAKEVITPEKFLAVTKETAAAIPKSQELKIPKLMLEPKVGLKEFDVQAMAPLPKGIPPTDLLWPAKAVTETIWTGAEKGLVEPAQAFGLAGGALIRMYALGEPIIPVSEKIKQIRLEGRKEIDIPTLPAPFTFVTGVPIGIKIRTPPMKEFLEAEKKIATAGLVVLPTFAMGPVGLGYKGVQALSAETPEEAALYFGTGAAFGGASRLLGVGSKGLKAAFAAKKGAKVAGIYRKGELAVSKALVPGYFAYEGITTGVELSSALAEKDYERFEREAKRTISGLSGFMLGVGAGARLVEPFAARGIGRIEVYEKVTELTPKEKTAFEQWERMIKQAEKVEPPIKEPRFESALRLDKKAAKIVSEFTLRQKEKLILGGSLAQEAQLAIKGRKPVDVDFYTKYLGLSKELAADLTRAGVKRVSVIKKPSKVEITIKGEKAIEFHTEAAFRQNLRQVAGFLEPTGKLIAEAPSGIRMISLKAQLKRKLRFGAFEPHRKAKDMFDVKTGIESQKKRLRQFEQVARKEVREPGIKEIRPKKIGVRKVKKPTLKPFEKAIEKTIKDLAKKPEYKYPEYKVPKKPKAAYPTYPKEYLEATKYPKLKPPKVEPAYKLPKEVAKIIPPYKLPKEPEYKLPKKPSEIIPEYRPIKKPEYRPPYKLPREPAVYQPYVPPRGPPSYPPYGPPTKRPTYPPYKPPIKQPVYPPYIAPTKPPTYPPYKPPAEPPSYPPYIPPTKPPSYPPYVPPTKAPPKAPPIIPIPKEMDFKKLAKPKPAQAYHTLVRSKGKKVKGKFRPGKFVKVSKKPLTRMGALGKGAVVADDTVARSFMIEKTKGKPKPSRWDSAWNSLSLKFRPKIVKGKPRGPKNRYIEKTGFAIDTIGEHKGITVKGWLAKRKKVSGLKIWGLKKPKKRKGKKRRSDLAWI